MSKDNMPLISVKGLKKVYKGRTVLDIPELNFKEGKNYAFIGANGSGKSTFLRLLAGVIQPTEGEIIIKNFNRQMLAYLPQKPYTFSFSVMRNMLMSFPASVAPEEKKQQSMRLLQEVGIDFLAKSKGNRLSGGEGQRLALARLLVCEHKLLLLDEPSSATDIAGNELIENALKRYCEGNGARLIFATHALSQAQRLADEILFFSGGQLIEKGETQQMLKNPQSEQLKTFLRFWQS